MNMDKILSIKPYIIRAIYDWIIDNEMTVYIKVNAKSDALLIKVPQQYINSDNTIILDISPTAVENIIINDYEITFNASFEEGNYELVVPIDAIISIYSAEYTQGMDFVIGQLFPPSLATTNAALKISEKSKEKPTFTVIHGNKI